MPYKLLNRTPKVVALVSFYLYPLQGRDLYKAFFNIQGLLAIANDFSFFLKSVTKWLMKVG